MAKPSNTRPGARAATSTSPPYSIGAALTETDRGALRTALAGKKFRLDVVEKLRDGGARLRGGAFGTFVFAPADIAGAWAVGDMLDVPVEVRRGSKGPRFEIVDPARQAAGGVPMMQTTSGRTLADKLRAAGVAASGADTTDRTRPVRKDSHGPTGAGVLSHRVQDLAPAPAFALYIDDTGNTFSKGASGRSMGRLVGVLVPKHRIGGLADHLPPDFHAFDSTPETIDAVLDRLLASSAGILGFTFDAAHAPVGDFWMGLATELIHWVLRLMPLPDDEDGITRLDVVVEQHGHWRAGHKAEDLRTAVQREFALGEPARAARIDLASIEIGSQEEHPCLGYADAVAHTFGSSRRDARQRLIQSGLLDNALFRDGRGVRTAWDLLAQNQHPDERAFAQLVLHPDLEKKGSLASMVSERLASSCRADPSRFRRYLQLADEHLQSKAVDLNLATRQVAWLDGCRPQGEALTPRLQLALLVAGLEVANHRGETNPIVLDGLDSLGATLVRVVPSLVCQADLVRAVHHTNRFEFDHASRALERWRGADRRLAALQHGARVLSSLGQHAAFRGELVEAERHFAEALAEFQQLDDPVLRQGEITHTGTYRALAALDRADLPATEKRLLVDAVLGDRTGSTIARLAASGATVDRFAHHLLLRYLIQSGEPAEKSAYLAERARWPTGSVFPWPLIAAWRAALLDEAGDRESALGSVRKAVDSCEVGPSGSALWVIAQAIRAASSDWDASMAPQEEQLAKLERLLPGARVRVIDPIRRLARTTHPGFVGTLLRLLPFNYR